jgi:hypothetical protein
MTATNGRPDLESLSIASVPALSLSCDIQNFDAL